MDAYKEDVSGKRGHLAICQLDTGELSEKKKKKLAPQNNYIPEIVIIDAFDRNKIQYCCMRRWK